MDNVKFGKSAMEVSTKQDDQSPSPHPGSPGLLFKVATQDINFGISIKVPQKVDLKIPYILKKLSEEILGFIFLCLFLPSKLSFWAHLEGKKRQRKINPEIFFNNFLNI